MKATCYNLTRVIFCKELGNKDIRVDSCKEKSHRKQLTISSGQSTADIYPTFPFIATVTEK
jgi:hypothetical protein